MYVCGRVTRGQAVGCCTVEFIKAWKKGWKDEEVVGSQRGCGVRMERCVAGELHREV